MSLWSYVDDNFSRAHSLRSTLLQISREACSTSIIDLKSFVTQCGVEDQEETSLGLLFKQDIEDCHHDHGLGLFTKLQYSKFICPGDTSLLQEFYSVCGTQKFVESLQLSDVQYNSSNILQESGLKHRKTLYTFKYRKTLLRVSKEIRQEDVCDLMTFVAINGASREAVQSTGLLSERDIEENSTTPFTLFMRLHQSKFIVKGDTLWLQEFLDACGYQKLVVQLKTLDTECHDHYVNF